MEKAQAKIAALKAELRSGRRQAAPLSSNKRRCHQVVLEILGQKFEGVWGWDCLQPLKQRGREALDYLVLVLTASGEPPKIVSPP